MMAEVTRRQKLPGESTFGGGRGILIPLRFTLPVKPPGQPVEATDSPMPAPSGDSGSEGQDNESHERQ